MCLVTILDEIMVDLISWALSFLVIFILCAIGMIAFCVTDRHSPLRLWMRGGRTAKSPDNAIKSVAESESYSKNTPIDQSDSSQLESYDEEQFQASGV